MAKQEKNPRFCKLIFNDQDQVKLSIPRKFARIHGHRLSSRVVLKVPSGAKWPVDVVRSGGQIWLQNGWQQFVAFYSIRYGSFLVFEYEKSSGDFIVIIFNRSCKEINYPFGDHESANVHEPNTVDDDDDDVSVEILDHFPPSRNAKGKSIIPVPSNEEVVEVDVSSPRKLKEKLIPSFYGHGKKMEQGTGSRVRQEKKGNTDGVVKKPQRLEKADLPFSIAILPTHLLRGDYRVAIPSTFADKYLTEWEGKLTLLNSEDRKAWLVKYSSVYIKKRKVVRVCRGWKDFAEQYHLKVGDLCIFEMIDKDPMLLKVSIFGV